MKRYIKKCILGKNVRLKVETDNDMFFFEHFALGFGINRQKQETKIIQNGKYILFIKIWFANSEIRFYIKSQKGH